MSKVTVFGTGSFGTALANVLAENGHQVLMWGKNETTINEINEQHINSKYLKTAELNEDIEATLDIETAVAFADIYLMALPTKAMREVAQTIDSLLSSKKTFIHVAKGIENDTYKRVSEMLEDSISPKHNAGIGVLSGPSHAEEVVIKQPTTVAASSKSESVRQLTQDLFMNDYLRVYTNEDLVGVELGGALKNIIAVASGVISGMGFGDNAKAALMTRGLAEISRLGEKLGANPITFLGLGGIGDLIVTCTSTHSRNYTLGYKLGEGKSLDTALNEMNMVVEGVYTTKSVYHLSKEVNVDMPITTALYKVLFENRPVDESVKDLMGRGKKAE
ncbi:glycerol-3-phosphate dehydrogenase [Staphylococcus saprophyticus]|jgi:glycerol-3-phosphate dehydrogenase (NAD(P)+)|uniref:Glycerol-3-phosphate dehydrogenase [NAD(P)+] n=1 Tax=Staphylococcus saprophyticus subsp. saprophyticus (strain ATCC 15305 / DSM 20229 / NCIMB 8711 / NCTC 7292 / S-41) TaxID=342451 RepID=GPDA_STAS1|nr:MULTISPECIES: NAD(P)H-dependent glycerol-3-phosphate dehydrogenase [Staphylococcus]Q49XS8.1 RecName: Full=Glycerol-3-phosphate dehydrogenase [NAD(P)+]; AltName: Full=NAD(P)H-dependent glycerol-3-phosphate dehydrogenase [Staphylococcus saprophyticus subsp. saprophyticus ATCC 15305 = NCTC 7292]CRV18745.1 NAD(P)H-dependent glycerol-3-phosphate dehydrogenase [Streptococcus equi subsp. equi]AMG20379.1 glycerol-3-phosphate dehydrogenase (NAD(P)(+)) [Staphylococcus saprophyticus]AMG33438.1 glycerol